MGIEEDDVAFPDDRAWAGLAAAAHARLSEEHVAALAGMLRVPLTAADRPVVTARLNAVRRVLDDLDGRPWRGYDPVTWESPTAVPASSAPSETRGTTASPHPDTILDLAARLRRREVSPVDLVERALARIEALNGQSHALITVLAERAKEQARTADRELAAGHDRGPLHGIPFTVKDLFDIAGIRTTGGSRLFEDYVPEETATALRRLEEAGAICVGKANLSEFAMGGTVRHPFGDPVNPWGAEWSPGSSSNGSAVSVMNGMAAFSIGSDTAGSIRHPAAVAGAYGFKPSYGRVSRHGVWPLLWSFDTVGVIARSATDCRVVAEAIAGLDPFDATTAAPSAVGVPGFDRPVALRGRRVAVIEEYSRAEVGSDIDSAFGRFTDFLEGSGATLARIAVPEMASAGTLYAAVKDVDNVLLHADLGRVLATVDETSRLNLLTGALMPAHWASKANRLLAHARESLRARFAETDAVVWLGTGGVTPSVATVVGPSVARTPEEVIAANEARVGSRVISNIAGVPTIALPLGNDRRGAPMSVQVGAAIYRDDITLGIGEAWERVLGPLPAPPASGPHRA
ncbi:MAG: amidase [Dehalococcoidia bacterium]|nr:MAG: amidase [Dehalococcoidia bacterium]